MTQSTKSNRNGSASNNAGRRSNGNDTKPKATSVKPQSAILALSEDEQIAALTAQLPQAIAKFFTVPLRDREQRQSTKVGYAAREILGNDLSAMLKKNGKTLDWNRFNKFFAHVFGEPEDLKYSPRVIAALMAQLFDRFSLDVDIAIEQLVEFNRESLDRRNRQQQDQDEFDDEFDDEFEGEAKDELDEEVVNQLDDDEFGEDEFGEDE
jgi:hypothetical protein